MYADMALDPPSANSSCDCGQLEEDYPADLIHGLHSGYWEIPVGVFNLIFTLIGIGANSFSLSFFVKKQKKDVITILFVCLCSVDLITSLTIGVFETLLSAGAFRFTDFEVSFNEAGQPQKASYIVLTIITFFFYTEVRFSVFLFAVMSVSRCVSIIMPFYRINKRFIVSLMASYLLYIVGLCIWPLFTCSQWSYKLHPLVRIGQMDFGEQVAPSEGKSALEGLSPTIAFLIIMFEIVTLFLPVVPIVVSCLITSYKLLFSKAMQSSNIKTRRDGAVTVLILTISTLIISLPRLTIAASFMLIEKNVVDMMMDVSAGFGWTMTYLAMTGATIANAGINPLVFFIRGAQLRRYFQSSITSVVNLKVPGRRRMERKDISMYQNRTVQLDLSAENLSNGRGNDTTQL